MSKDDVNYRQGSWHPSMNTCISIYIYICTCVHMHSYTYGVRTSDGFSVNTLHLCTCTLEVRDVLFFSLGPAVWP